MSELNFDVGFSEYPRNFKTYFEDYIVLYRGVERVWIGDGSIIEGHVTTIDGHVETSYASKQGWLYAEMVDGLIQEVGPVSAYWYALQSGFVGTFEDWVQLIIDGSVNAQAAASSAAAALASQRSAASSATNASASASAAATSASNAATSATNADQSASAASSSKSAAAQSATNANQSASAASQSATDAASSASTASQKASEASTSANNASASKTAAATSETNAAASASQASTFASNAATSATNAAASAQTASAAATEIQSATTTVTYQNSTSGTIIPSGTWTNSPSPERGKYLWTKTVIQWGNLTSSTLYSVAYDGLDGNVISVNGLHGSVVLDGSNIYVDNTIQNKETIIHAINRIDDTIFDLNTLPDVTTSDNGKFLRVSNGQWVAQTVPNANEGTY